MNSSNNNIPISAILITNRSDTRFEAALASVQSCAEVLVIDNNSGADWTQLHKKYHFTKIATAPHPITNFAAARNDSMQFATHSWVFFLDSDEVLTNPIALNEAIETAEATTAGFTITRSDVFLGTPIRFGEAAKQNIVRLCKKEQTQFVGKVHEVAKVVGVVQKSDVTILHNSHTSISEFLADVASYANLLTTKKHNWNVIFFLQMLTYPPLKFIYNYVVKLGFLDGKAGLTYALIMSCHSFWVRVFIYEKSRK